MTERTELKPDWPWASNFSIAQGVKVGDEVFVSGQVALDRDGNVVGAGDMKAQTRQTFENIRTVLAEAGATMDDVVKILAFITDMSKYPDYAAVRAEAVSGQSSGQQQRRHARPRRSESAGRGRGSGANRQWRMSELRGAA